MGELEQVGPNITDIEDLEDALDILEPIVKDLRSEQLTVPQLEILLNQYITIEDSLLQGFQLLSERYEIDEDSTRLHKCTFKFNEFCADYQDTWTDDYWAVYENIREGYKDTDKAKSILELTEKITELQELAIAMNRKSGKIEVSDCEELALKEVDELARKYESSTVGESCENSVQQAKNKSCCAKCRIF